MLLLPFTLLCLASRSFARSFVRADFRSHVYARLNLSILIRDSLDNAKHNVDKDTLWGFTHTVGHRGPSENTI